MTKLKDFASSYSDTSLWKKNKNMAEVILEVDLIGWNQSNRRLSL
uniref:Uncharacterized protein n=1 Tax=Rhizophora mucronata TaxID=61149 RepID=A0A2P2PKG9_RHIMU